MSAHKKTTRQKREYRIKCTRRVQYEKELHSLNVKIKKSGDNPLLGAMQRARFLTEKISRMS